MLIDKPPCRYRFRFCGRSGFGFQRTRAARRNSSRIPHASEDFIFQVACNEKHHFASEKPPGELGGNSFVAAVLGNPSDGEENSHALHAENSVSLSLKAGSI